MIGPSDRPGLLSLTLKKVFEVMDSKSGEKSYGVKFSYMEIYNEAIRDMMGYDTTTSLELREDPSKGLIVAGLSEQVAVCEQSVYRMVLAGNKNRVMDNNQCSTRSHAIFQVVVEQFDRCAGIESEVKFSKLCFIDLAGSEKASRNPKGIEGTNINRSLLALGNCINKLADSKIKNISHIPYRDSKLTRLLKDSLGGNCQTIMIGNISCTLSSYEDTLNTLKYASRAKNIKTSVQKNVINVQPHVSQYVQIITQLKKEIMTLKSKLPENIDIDNTVDYIDNTKNVTSLLNEIKEHYKNRFQLKRKLFFEKGKIAELSFLKKYKENDKLIKDLCASQEDIQRKLEENKISQIQLQEKAKRLPGANADAALKLISHQEDLVDKIPIEGKIRAHKAKKYFSLQNTIIIKLKEQIKLRDDILESYKGVSKESFNVSSNASDSYGEIRSPQTVNRRVSSPILLRKLIPIGREKSFIRHEKKRSSSILHKSDKYINDSYRKLRISINSPSFLIPDSSKSNNKGKLRARRKKMMDIYSKIRTGRPQYYNLKEIKPSILAKSDKSIF